jgi:ABC-2 type transport system ATP-binding protein
MLGASLGEYGRSTELRRRMGVQLQRNRFPDNVSVADLLALHEALYRESSPELAGALRLSELAQLQYGKLSRGQRQRLDLYMALGHQPEVAILDEPLTGLDAGFASAFAAAVKRSSSKLVMMATHAESDVAAADHIIWLERGRVLTSGLRAEVLNRTIGRYKLEMRVKDEAAFACLEQALRERTGIVNVSKKSTREMIVFSQTRLDDLLVNMGGSAVKYSVGESSEEDFLEMVAGQNAQG